MRHAEPTRGTVGFIFPCKLSRRRPEILRMARTKRVDMVRSSLLPFTSPAHTGDPCMWFIRGPVPFGFPFEPSQGRRSRKSEVEPSCWSVGAPFRQCPSSFPGPRPNSLYFVIFTYLFVVLLLLCYLFNNIKKKRKKKGKKR